MIPTTCLGFAFGESGLASDVLLDSIVLSRPTASWQVVRMIPPPAGGGASRIVAGSQRIDATMVRRLAIPRLARQLWRSAYGGRRQVVG